MHLAKKIYISLLQRKVYKINYHYKLKNSAFLLWGGLHKNLLYIVHRRFMHPSLTWRSPRLPLIFWLFGTFVGIEAFLLSNARLNMVHVFGFVLVLAFLYHFGDINPIGWMVSLIVFMTLVFLKDLGLRPTINRKWL